MTGLVLYLVGPGRHNEHTEPHLITGSPGVMAWHDDAELSDLAAVEIARVLDHPRKAFGTAMNGGHVWHCSLSLRAEEGRISDEKWQAIVHDFMEGMGFEDDAKAPMRYVAIHHGTSTAGNDHVHIAANLIREDGTRANVWNDFPRSQKVAAELEVKHGLEVLEARGSGLGGRGVTPAEQAQAKREGLVEPHRVTLERAVRGAAAASADEAEFVRRLRADRILVRPRYAAGTDDVVVGYSVALKPTGGAAPSWFGGGRLAKDLTLPRLREAWPDTPETATEGAAEWGAAKRHRPVVKPGRELGAMTETDWSRFTGELRELRAKLHDVPVDDRVTWAQVAGDTAGAFAAWSRRVEDVPGPLAETAAALARSAQVRAHVTRESKPAVPRARGAALLLASVGNKGRGTVAQAAMLRQLMNTAKALHDAHVAVGEAQRAAQIAGAIRGRLLEVRDALPALELQPAGGPNLSHPGATLAPDRQRPLSAPVPNALRPLNRQDAGARDDPSR